MVLKSFLVRSKSRSRLYLVKKCWGKKRRFCIRCQIRKIYRLVEKRYRCTHSRYTFQDFSGRWIGHFHSKRAVPSFTITRRIKRIFPCTCP